MISSGQDRTVWEWLPDKRLVAKVELGARAFQNVFEYETWQRVKDTKWARWFAPVETIGPSGVMLLMRRTAPAQPTDYPRKVPRFFTDLKRANWGRLGGELVCHDYGRHLLMEEGMTSKLKVARWWNE
jgi:hypothetical protein